MSDLAGFPPEAIGLILLTSSVYFLVGWAPVIWPVLATHRVRHTFPRRWLFVLTILSLSYGVIVAFLMLLSLPVAAYSTFIAPQLAASGFHGTDWLVRANNLVVDYWWLMLPPALLFITFFLVRKLQPTWPSVCSVLTANNSLKPKPLRGSA
jgi:hypothetical protein